MIGTLAREIKCALIGSAGEGQEGHWPSEEDGKALCLKKQNCKGQAQKRPCKDSSPKRFQGQRKAWNYIDASLKASKILSARQIPILAFFWVFEILTVMFVERRAKHATPLLLRSFLGHPMEEKFTFSWSLSQGHLPHKVSSHLEQNWSLKRAKNKQKITFLPSFQHWRCTLRSLGRMDF